MALPWAAGAAALWLVVLYFLRQPKFSAQVPHAPLWRGVQKSRRPRRSLVTWLSLLLQGVLLALLLLALARPRWGDTEPARSIVVLLDASASMQARDAAATATPTEAAPSRFSVAVRALESWLRALQPDDSVLLVRLGPQALPVAGFTNDHRTLLHELSQLQPGDSSASWVDGLRLARASLEGRVRPEILLVSDGAGLVGRFQTGQSPQPAPWAELSDLKMTWLPTGGGAHNVAITQMAVRRYPASRGRFAFQLQLENYGPQPSDVELTLFTDEQPLLTRSLHMGPAESRSISEAGLGARGHVLKARIVAPRGRNALSVDDQAWALLPEPAPLRVLLVSRDNRYLEAALLLDASLAVTAVRPSDPLPTGPFDVAVYDGVLARPRAAAPAALYLNPPPGGPVRLGRRIRNFGFDRVEEQHPIWQHIAPNDIQVLRGNALRTAPGDVVLGASVLGPILVSGQRAEQRFLALGFDPRESDFVLRVAWPLFVLNALSVLAPQVGDAQRALNTARLAAVSLSEPLSGASELWWHPPAGPPRAVAVAAGTFEFRPEQVGLHALSGSQRAVLTPPGEPQGGALRWVAANLANPAESRIEPPAQLALGGRVLTGQGEAVASTPIDVWGWLVAAWLALASVEWWTFHRRLTV